MFWYQKLMVKSSNIRSPILYSNSTIQSSKPLPQTHLWDQYSKLSTKIILLVIGSIPALVRMMRSWNLSLWRRTLHSGRGRSSGSRPHPRTESPWLVEWWAKGTFILRELRIVMVWWWGIYWTRVLRWRARWRMVHVRWQLTHEVSRRRGDRRRNWGQRWRRGLAKDLCWMLHWMSDWGWRRWRPVALLRWSHHVVWVGNHRLPWIFSWVVMWRGVHRLTGGRACWIILNGDGDEVAMLPCGHCSNAECLLSERARRPHVGCRSLARRGPEVIMRGRRWLSVGVMSGVWKRGRDEHMGFGHVSRGHTETLWNVRARKMVRVRAACWSLARSHVAVVDVGLQVSLWEVGTFTALNDAAHEKRAALTLFNPLNWVCTAIQSQTERIKRMKYWIHALHAMVKNFAFNIFCVLLHTFRGNFLQTYPGHILSPFLSWSTAHS